MSKYESALAEAAYVIAGNGFAVDECGSVDEWGWHALVVVSPVLLLNVGEADLAERVRAEVGDAEQDVLVREDSQGFVDVLAHGPEAEAAYEEIAGALS